MLEVFSPLLTQSLPLASHVVLDWQGWFTVIVFLSVFLCMIFEVLPPDIIMLSGGSLLVLSGILSVREFLEGFSADIIVTLAMLFVVAHTMELAGVLNVLARYTLPATSYGSWALITLMFPVIIFSAFLNNTPIVLMMTPVVRKWAMDMKKSPSKYLIPLSYASILGGACTLIGTSTNLVVDGLLRAEYEEAGLSFFEIGTMGVPCAVIGVLYMLLVGKRLLPERRDPAMALTAEPEKFTGEFLVTSECPVANLTVRQAGRQFFRGEHLIEVERGTVLLDSPGPDEVLLEGDRLIFAGDIKNIAELHTVPGLQSLADPHFKLDFTSSHFSEVVISITSSLIGKTLKRVDFRNQYGASVIAVYRQGRRVPGRVGDVVLHSGDTLMLLSGELWVGGDSFVNDFYYIKHNVKIPLYSKKQVGFVIGVLALMIGSVLFGLPMVLASIGAAVVLLLTRNISIFEARKSIQWNLLILIGSSFALGASLRQTGVAQFLAELLLSLVGTDPYFLIAGIFFLTMLATEAITNNAAALLIFPIALQTARLAGYTGIEATKAVGVTVALAASFSFLTPIGYQTNTIVYGPGGYRFVDYTRVGIGLSAILAGLCIWGIPHLWPLS